MIVSVEIPVFKGAWLQRCIDTVLYQTSPNWHLSLLWDGGDEESRRILEKLQRRKHHQVTVHFGPNRGIARARAFLSEHSRGDFILPVDDDDALPFHAVERFLQLAQQKPWASIIRAQRKIVDEEGKVLDTPPWFPFEPRHYQDGMVTDLFNHCHPYLMRRSAYAQTAGWEGFPDFRYAGEDCDLYLKLEELGTIELVDEVLYYYRINQKRASLVLTDDAAYEMWRRLADKTIGRIGLPLRRTTDKQPFRYERLPKAAAQPEGVDFLILNGAGTERPAGVAADACHAVADSSPAGVNRVLRGAQRAVACIVARMPPASTLEQMLRALQNEDLDLSVSEEGPVLVRREVVRAVGGLDDGFQDLRAALLDFCLRARQRDFKCDYRPAVNGIPEADLDRLRAKWSSRPDLLPQ